ncbi:hypothetical protein [Streptomyces sp. HYC2]|uniref:hypothetical protein n=1 Tax=Streptomyces sp. HYC2 TaxID=2955207 RepID=UPI002480F888|nr:hypothetical protein [Streptomyces sp. HYC2]
MWAATVEIVVWCGVLTGVTVVSVSSVSPVELTVAGLASLGGASAARRMRLATGVHVTGARRAARAAVPLPYAVARGLAVLVSSVATRPGDAAVRRVRLRPGAHAAWAGTLIATAPDTCVIGIPRDDVVLVHALRPDAGPVEAAVARTGGRR